MSEKESPTVQNELDLDSLVNQLSASTEYNDLRQKMNKIEKSKTKVSAALPKLQREKLERKVAYEDSKEKISIWNGIVVKNRKEEFARFEDAEPERIKLSSDAMTAKFQPSTDMEKEIDVILEQSEMKEKSVRDKESRDLEMNKLSVEDVKARNEELARMKTLLFYQEQKNKRINKIKSKKYHKIRKRAEERREEKMREILKQTDPERYKELLEKDAVKRAKERMSLKHKNTSKWIKRALQHGGMSDAMTREAINEQLREGEKLRAKMQGEEASSEEEEATKEELLEDAEAMLREIDADKEQEHRGVFQMEFMKRAVERQRQEARQEAEQLIQALQEEKEFDEEEKGEKEEEEPAENAAILSALAEGGVRRQKKKGKSLEVTEHIALGADRSANGANGANGASGASGASTGPLFTAPVVPSVFGDAEAVGGSRLLEEISDAESEPEQPEQSEQPEEKAEQKAEETENPWLAAATDNVSHSAARRAEEKAEEAVDVQAALASLEQKAPAKRSREVVKGELGFEELGQSELLGMAFEDASAEKEFQEAKQKEVEQALEAAKPVVLDGWGSWAGIGAPQPKKPRVAAPVKVPERSDAKLKHVIINQSTGAKQKDFVVEGVPFPFTSREQYERAMRQPLGREWNSSVSFASLNQPEVKTRRGTIIEPIKLPKRKSRF
ncbi:hypothetical protein WA556_001566 [Blastocystis sp. ATCC 50177/Nand II]